MLPWLPSHLLNTAPHLPSPSSLLCRAASTWDSAWHRVGTQSTSNDWDRWKWMQEWINRATTFRYLDTSSSHLSPVAPSNWLGMCTFMWGWGFLSSPKVAPRLTPHLGAPKWSPQKSCSSFLAPFLCMSWVCLAETQLPLVVKVGSEAQGSSAELNFAHLAVWAYSDLLMF